MVVEAEDAVWVAGERPYIAEVAAGARLGAGAGALMGGQVRTEAGASAASAVLSVPHPSRDLTDPPPCWDQSDRLALAEPATQHRAWIIALRQCSLALCKLYKARHEFEASSRSFNFEDPNLPN